MIVKQECCMPCYIAIQVHPAGLLGLGVIDLWIYSTLSHSAAGNFESPE